MKRVLICLMFLAATVMGQTAATLPHDGVGALVWYNQAGHPRVNGSFAYYVQMPGGSAGTYLYNSFDFVSSRTGIVGVPQAGIMQHILDFSPELHLFALAGGGASFAPSTNGTNVGAAFSGGGGVSYDIGKKGFSVVFLTKAIQAVSGTTLVGGVGIGWGH